MKHSLSIVDTGHLEEAAREFLSLIQGHRIIAFYAPMGAGKTTFTSALCRILGVNSETVSSPTFSIINEYRSADGESIFHFDFYRINKLSEALDIGLYDYLDSGELCLIEWPEKIEELLPEETLRVEIAVLEDGSRVLSWED